MYMLWKYVKFKQPSAKTFVEFVQFYYNMAELLWVSNNI